MISVGLSGAVPFPLCFAIHNPVPRSGRAQSGKGIPQIGQLLDEDVRPRELRAGEVAEQGDRDGPARERTLDVPGGVPDHDGPVGRPAACARPRDGHELASVLGVRAEGPLPALEPVPEARGGELVMGYPLDVAGEQSVDVAAFAARLSASSAPAIAPWRRRPRSASR